MSISRKSELPPDKIIPRSMMSAANSGGVTLKTDWIWFTMSTRCGLMAPAVSSDVIIMSLGRPDDTSLPRTLISRTFFVCMAVPTPILMFSAVDSPMKSPYFFFTYSAIDRSNSVPAMRKDDHATMPPKEITATSVVPPPIFTTMLPSDECMGMPAPSAASRGSFTKCTSRAPASFAAFMTARNSVDVMPAGTDMTTSGRKKLKRPMLLPMKYFSIRWVT